MNKISLENIKSNAEFVLIDVREPLEFKEIHIPGALNFPSSTYSSVLYQQYEDKSIVIVCQNGSRSQKIAEKLLSDGFKKVFILDKQMANLTNDAFHKTINKGWTVDRQFRMTLGVLLVTFLLGFHFVSPYFMVIPAILATGLVFTSIIDRCYMRMAIAQLPWNKGKTE